jgi:protein-disulfide isomerase
LQISLRPLALPPPLKKANVAARIERWNGSIVNLSASSPVSRRALVRAAALLPSVVLCGAAFAQQAPKPDATVDMAKALEPGPLPELSMGSATGVPVIEYGSATCPHCAHFDKDIWPEFKKTYVDTGKVRFIFREYSRNELDVAAYMLARCLGDDKAFAAIELLFSSQDSWAFASGNPLDNLMAALRPTGLAKDKASVCLKDQAKADAYAKIVKTADDDFKITGTPGFIIDGKVYGGALSMDELNAILKPLIK